MALTQSGNSPTLYHSPVAHHRIQEFGRISKAQPAPVASKKRSLDEDHTRSTKAPKFFHAKLAVGRVKRTRAPSPDDSSDDDHVSRKPREDHNNQAQRTKAVAKRRCARQDVIPRSTPHKDTLNRLANLALASPRIARGRVTDDVRSDPVCVPPTDPKFSQYHTPAFQWPDEIYELDELNSAFLTALSLHYAHHGTSVPVDLRELMPSIAKVWGKRKILLEDIQRCLAVTQGNPTLRASNARRFQLSDYGRGKICLETVMQGEENGIFGGYIDEDKLNARFHDALLRHWASWSSSANRQLHCQDTLPFIRQLPLEDVVPCSSLEKVAPLLAKGQRRLHDIKADAAKAQEDATAKRQMLHTRSTKTGDTAQPVASRSAGLLDRILAKQQQKSHLPPPRTKEETERRAALHRLEEVIPVVALLASSKGASHRAAFSLPALVQSLQGSMRNPISKEEATRCVELMAREIAPGYVSVASMGSIVGVVINKPCRPTAAAVAQRVSAAEQ